MKMEELRKLAGLLEASDAHYDKLLESALTALTDTKEHLEKYEKELDKHIERKEFSVSLNDILNSLQDAIEGLETVSKK